MGGNYVFKATPYYPPLDVVRQNAKAMAEGRGFNRPRLVTQLRSFGAVCHVKRFKRFKRKNDDDPVG